MTHDPHCPNCSKHPDARDAGYADMADTTAGHLGTRGLTRGILVGGERSLPTTADTPEKLATLHDELAW